MVVQPGSSNSPLLAQAFPFQLDAVGVVDEPVQDGVGDGGSPALEPLLLTQPALAFEQDAKPLRVPKGRSLRVVRQIAETLGHAVQAKVGQ